MTPGYVSKDSEIIRVTHASIQSCQNHSRRLSTTNHQPATEAKIVKIFTKTIHFASTNQFLSNLKRKHKYRNLTTQCDSAIDCFCCLERCPNRHVINFMTCLRIQHHCSNSSSKQRSMTRHQTPGNGFAKHIGPGS